jgi:hypothetical protein
LKAAYLDEENKVVLMVVQEEGIREAGKMEEVRKEEADAAEVA